MVGENRQPEKGTLPTHVTGYLMLPAADLQTQHATVNSGECLQVVRYPWYATSVLNCCPSWLTWLRSALPLSLTDIDTCMPGKHLYCMCTARVVYYMCTLCCMR